MTGEDGEPCEVLPWDTAFFGFPVARIRGGLLDQRRAEHIDTWCHCQGIRCLYLLSSASDSTTTWLAEVHGFHFVDIRVTFERKFNGEEAVGAHFFNAQSPIVRSSTLADLDVLHDIARVSFRDTRFYYDTHFPREKSDALYGTWITKSCQGEADVVLVAEDSGKAVGFITCHLDDRARRGNIGLIGVCRAAQGRGVGQALVNHALSWFQMRGVDAVSVVTQGRNIGAQRLYERAGFLVREVQLWYHKWFDVATEHRTE